MKTKGTRTWRFLVPVLLVLLVPTLFLTSCKDSEGRPLYENKESTYGNPYKPIALYYDTTQEETLGENFGCSPSQFKKTLEKLVIIIGESISIVDNDDVSQFTATAEIDFDEDATQFDGELWHFVGHNKITVTGRYNYDKDVIDEGTIEITSVGYKTNQYKISELQPAGSTKIEFNCRYSGPTLCTENNESDDGTDLRWRLISRRGTKTLTEHWTFSGQATDHNYEDLTGYYPYFVQGEVPPSQP